ncbi:glutamine--tRNA ligase/YqeY domain fusion protein [Paenibacillus sp. CGMCC 1.16610]|uniref:Glutamine--tRNA ligase n=1 Tax=Paenibacillus anseongense TaxID=2682845 RepID=A0ABW9UDZ4_9BACL|nr:MULTISPECIES: glutamine--tRNA ligase/YqeY domain fusion protein [Paenibacillus]MBA2937552.1 glutamine--tRNA ligase/YqeY domain fusion protein [Paenibacillus sp. CGMCC 1.16610]MVQ36610.1 glutamine--tRNA ligase/YqeY domain fusion protein [Paenibacillus anseongense]
MNNMQEHLTDNFILKLIHEEIGEKAFGREMCTRFPPEPNGYLHIGSAYAIHTNYTVARKFNGTFHLRFDDTNPLKEDIKYVNAIIEDIKWLGYDPEEHIYYGSDYSNEIYNAAITLIKRGKAYVCDLTPEEVTAYRGTLTEPGIDSPYRNRTIEANLELFVKMKNGEFPTSSKVLRAKIDMRSSNLNLRDPVIYRIIHAKHYRTGDDWCIYPMYDFAHPIQDAIEGITYSLCSIEFKDHRPLYEWVLNELEISEPPRQREFGRLNLTGVVTSKRFLRQLVEGGYVDGWDDPRLPTLRGLRRRGFTPESIRTFIEEIGSIRTQSTVDISLMDHCLRQDLKEKTVTVMAVLQPLKVIITNYPEDVEEMLLIENNSENEALGKREVPFGKTIYIEREDFMEIPSKGFHRLSLHTEVRLKGAYFIRCEEVIRDHASGEITELRCTYDPETKSGTGFTGRKVKGTIHWVSSEHAVKADIHLYEKLLLDQEVPKDSEDWMKLINPNSMVTIQDAWIEPYIETARPEQKFQFLRHGYFSLDTKNLGTSDRLVFNRVVPLKDAWSKKER